MQILRTPDERFRGHADFPYEPSFVEVPVDPTAVAGSGPAAGDGPGPGSSETLRMAYIEAGPPDADPVLLLHGEPSWSYLYRHMVPVLTDAGHRVVAPDLVGFGRSDKPAAIADHTYARQVGWMAALLASLDLERITLFCQDWGGLIGLRLLAEHPDRFSRTVAANTGLPVGNARMPDVWQQFRDVVVSAETLDVGRVVASGCVRGLDDAARRAYDAPFPDEAYKAGPRALPDLIPQRPDDPASDPNRRAWRAIAALDKPFLVAFSDSDPITAAARDLLVDRIGGAQGLEHPVITDAGHFLQEDAGPDVADVVVRFIADTSR